MLFKSAQPSYQWYLQIFLHSIFIYSSQYTQLVMAAFQDDCIRFPKVKCPENDESWAIFVKAALKDKTL